MGPWLSVESPLSPSPSLCSTSCHAVSTETHLFDKYIELRTTPGELQGGKCFRLIRCLSHHIIAHFSHCTVTYVCLFLSMCFFLWSNLDAQTSQHPSERTGLVCGLCFIYWGVKVSQPHFQISLKVFGFLEHKHDLLTVCAVCRACCSPAPG